MILSLFVPDYTLKCAELNSVNLIKVMFKKYYTIFHHFSYFLNLNFKLDPKNGSLNRL